MKTKRSSAGLVLALLLATTVSAQRDKRPFVRQVTQSGVLYFNGANFDPGEKTHTTYVGHLNLYAPSFFGIRSDLHWGFNTGVLRLKYNGNDTLLQQTQIENVQIDPLRPMTQGSKYLRQLNSYSGSIKRSTTSYYFQPLFRLFPFAPNEAAKTQIYLHGHFELLLSKWSSTVNMTTLTQDTATYDTTSHAVFRSGLNNTTQTYNSTHEYGYFGGGLTFDFCPWDNGSFFFQPTAGITTDYPQYVNAAGFAGPLLRPDHSSFKKFNGFYLVRAYYTQSLSSGATGVLGIDVRGILPKYAPQFAAYIGVNLKLDALFQLLGSKAATVDPRTKKVTSAAATSSLPSTTTPTK